MDHSTAQQQVRYQSAQSNPAKRMKINVAVNDKVFVNETVTEIIQDMQKKKNISL